MLKERKVPRQRKNSKPGPKKKTKAKRLRDKKNTMTDRGKGSWVLIPVLLACLFRLLSLICHARAVKTTL